MTPELDQNEEEKAEQDSLALASLLYDVYQEKKLEEIKNVSSNI